MKTKDHVLLTEWLLEHQGKELPAGFAAGFRFGSVLPDYNPFTYLRGIIGIGRGKPHGHNAEVTRHKVIMLIKRFRKKAGSGYLNGLYIGTVIHYIADAFTYPHHDYYPGTLSDHVAYEWSLHRSFAGYLRGISGTSRTTERVPACCPDCVSGEGLEDFEYFFDKMLRLYRVEDKNEYTDCRFITFMCSYVFENAVIKLLGNEPQNSMTVKCRELADAFAKDLPGLSHKRQEI